MFALAEQAGIKLDLGQNKMKDLLSWHHQKS